MRSTEDDPTSDYAIYPVTKSFLPVVATWPMTGDGPRGDWIGRRNGPTSQIIAPGDKVDITIWDNEENSLLTPPEQKVVTMPTMTVSPNGSIFIPYVGEVEISGSTPQAARMKLQSRLEAIVPSAQVQLTQETGRMNSISLVGGVSAPGSYPLEDRNMTVLSLISMGGGVREGLESPIVRLIRASTLYVTTVSRLYNDPALDTTLVGGDKVIVEEDPRAFLALGAVGSEKRVQFPTDRVTALDAVALMGGISDFRADPKGLLILREYDADAVNNGPGAERVIFTVDLTSADGLFSAGKFEINPSDLVYASESPVTAVDTIARIAGSLLGLGTRVDTLSN